MTDPARRAKPVGPPPPDGPQQRAPHGTSPAGQSQYGHGAPPQPRMRVYTWSSQGRGFPWLAVLLLVLGVGLLIELLIPDLSFSSLIILAAGLAFAAVWLAGSVVGATVPALVLIGWGLAGVGSDLGILTGDGWTTLFIGAAFLIGWGLGRFQAARREWTLFIGIILAVIGLADVSDSLPFDVSLAVVIPLTMIGVGLYLVLRRWPTLR